MNISLIGDHESSNYRSRRVTFAAPDIVDSDASGGEDDDEELDTSHGKSDSDSDNDEKDNETQSNSLQQRRSSQKRTR